MKRLKIALFMLMLSVSAPAYEVTVGTIMGYGESEYKGVDGFMDMWGWKGPIPLVMFDSEYFFAGLPTVGVHALRNPMYNVDITLSLMGNKLDPAESADWAVQQMEERDVTLLLGVEGGLNTPFGSLKGQVKTDILGTSDTLRAALSYSYPLPLLPNFIIIPSVTETWENASHFDYYYGVSAAEAARSGLNTYSPDSGLTTSFEIMAIYMLTENLSLMGTYSYTILSAQVTESPLTNEHTIYGVSGGITYKFSSEKRSASAQQNKPAAPSGQLKNRQQQNSMEVLRNSRNTQNR